MASSTDVKTLLCLEFVSTLHAILGWLKTLEGAGDSLKMVGNAVVAKGFEVRDRLKISGRNEGERLADLGVAVQWVKQELV